MKGYITFLIVFIALIIILLLNFAVIHLSKHNIDLLKEEKLFYKTLHAKERIESSALVGSIVGWSTCFVLSGEVEGLDCLEPDIADLTAQIGALFFLNSLNYFLPNDPFDESYLCTNDMENISRIAKETVKHKQLNVVGWHNSIKCLPYITVSTPVDAIKALSNTKNEGIQDASSLVNMSLKVQIGKKFEEGGMLKEGRFYYIIYSPYLNESRVMLFPLNPVEIKLVNTNPLDLLESVEGSNRLEELIKNMIKEKLNKT